MDDLKQFAQPEFPESQTVGPRPWGEEELLVLSSGKYMMKRLTVKAGTKGGLQYHRIKDEAGILISGEMIIRYDDGSGGLIEKLIKPGDFFHFKPGVVHQEEAITECVIIEASTPDFNDRVRVEHLYGLGDPSGLPTTSLEEIETK
jgi:mannose-6-phosphate isomerase-like protein (cupin superfamily)